MEGCGGREEFCKPAQLASGISSDWLGLISSGTSGVGSPGQWLPRGRALRTWLTSFWSGASLICLMYVWEIDCVISDLHYSSPANQSANIC